ncbi:MAG: SDR family NAD(P)-dependent oxidoreductase [Acidimicrobiales bacterium]
MTLGAEPLLAGRRALVTGAAVGLGAAFARRLRANGARVVGIDQDPTAAGDDVVVADLADPAAAVAAVDDAAARLGGLDLVINNAGIIERSPLVGLDPLAALEVFDRVMAVNLRAPFVVARAALPHLLDRDRSAAPVADIVNVTTDHLHTCGWPWPIEHGPGSTCPDADGLRPPVTSTSVDVYDASKWGLTGMSGVWAHALAPHGIRVNALGMGATDTPMYRRMRGDRPPADGMMSPDDVADVAVELIAEGRSTADGGRTGDSVQLWVGHPCELPPPTAAARLAPAVIGWRQPTG